MTTEGRILTHVYARTKGKPGMPVDFGTIARELDLSLHDLWLAAANLVLFGYANHAVGCVSLTDPGVDAAAASAQGACSPLLHEQQEMIHPRHNTSSPVGFR